MALRIQKGTRSPSITDTLTIDGVPFDLTGSAVAFKMRAVGSATLKVNAAAAIVTPTAGAVRYDWQAADLDTAGDYLGWWSVTLPGGNVQDHPEFAIDVQEHGRPAGDLCEISDVREDMESSSQATDALIGSLIARASVALPAHAQREFTDAGTLTRTFRAEGSLIDLAPYDLRAATTVTDTPVGGSAATLVAGDDYDLDGPYLGGTYLYLRRGAGWVAGSTRFGYSRVAITGTWGMAAVPADVKHAAVVTVRSWLRRDAAAWSNLDFDPARGVAPTPPGGWMLPMAAKQLLDPYRRVVV